MAYSVIEDVDDVAPGAWTKGQEASGFSQMLISK